MPQSPHESAAGRLFKTSQVFLALVFFESLVTLVRIFSVPSDPDARFFLGISLKRWVISSPAFLIGVLSAGVFLWMARTGRGNRLVRFLDTPTAGKMIALGAAAAIPLVHLVAALIAASDNPSLRAGFTRLVPLIGLIIVIAAELFILSCFWVRSHAWEERKTLHLGLLLLAGTILAAGLAYSTGVGFHQTTQGWYEYGVPLTGQQVLVFFEAAILILAAGLLGSSVGSSAPARLRIPPILVDAGLVAAVWLIAILLWQSFPISVTWFSPRTFPPNYQVYPSSDALLYDTSAQGILLGARWARNVVHFKPLYVAVLTLLDGLAGSSYPRVILYQTFLLALLPVSLYLLGRSLLGRLTGLLVAAAAIAREMNQLSVAALTTLSTTKLLLSELPTALGISILLLVLVFWLQKPKPRAPFAFLAGGIIGLLIQVRLQTVLFLPAVCAVLLFCHRKQWKAGLKVSAVLVAGFLIATAPLVFINFRASGTFALEKPGYFSRTFAYAQSQAGRSDPSNGIASGPSDIPGSQPLLEFITGTGNHFIHNTVAAVLTLPTGAALTSVDLKRLLWLDYEAGWDWKSWILLSFNLSMMALGAAYAWHRKRLAGLLPALAFAIYNLSSAFVGFSGQRFILPVDWAGYFYFFAGLSWLASTLFAVAGFDPFHQLPFWINPKRQEDLATKNDYAKYQPKAFRTITLIATALLPLSLLLPLLEIAIPVRYPRLDEAQTCVEIVRAASAALPSAQLARLTGLLDDPGVAIASGVALYPREIATETGAGGVLRYAGETTYPVLSFIQLGAGRHWVLLPLAEMQSIVLPHGSETLVAGRWITSQDGETSIQAFVVVSPRTGAVYLSEAFSP